MTYSTYGYTLLGVIIEKASGQDYVDFVFENIFTPLGMRHSRSDDPHAIVPDRSRGYARTDAGSLRNAGFMNPSYKIPGGGWLSTVGDMVRFGLALQAGTLLKPESLQQMTTMQRAGGGKEDTFYGLGWIVDGWGIPDAPAIPGLVWHGGVQQGVTTNLFMLLPERTVVAVMTSVEGEGLELTKLAGEISRPRKGQNVRGNVRRTRDRCLGAQSRPHGRSRAVVSACPTDIYRGRAGCQSGRPLPMSDAAVLASLTISAGSTRPSAESNL